MAGGTSVDKVTFDLDAFPFVIMRFPDVGTSDADIDHLIETFEGLYKRGQRYGILGFAGGIRAAPTIKQRKRLTDFETRTRPLAQRWCVATGLVIGSPIARGAVTAMRWVSPAPSPEVITASELDATEFVIRHMRAEGTPGLDKAEAFLRSLRTRK